jgi:plasmid stabilization system protein ParE
MPKKTPVTFAASAVKDMERIREWYAEQQASDAGNRLIMNIMAQIERLSAFPESGRMVPEFGIANLREIILSPFRIVYRLDKNRARIVRIWRSERQLTMP